MDSRTRHLLKVGVVANVFEWYEFTIFGFLVGLIGQLFFKSPEPIVELLRAYSVFALSFIARPVGGLFFGLIGDRIGRSAALRLSLVLMSIPTILIGLLPTYDQAGITAIISLVTLRLIQGFAAGGELPTTACYVFESSLARNRSLLCSAITASPKIGMLLASLVAFCLIRWFDEPTLLAWAWRIPFLLGIPLTFAIIYIRRMIHEPITPSKSSRVAIPTHLGWASLVRPLLQAVILVSFGALCFYLIFVWMPVYLSYFLGISSSIAHFTNTLVLCAILPFYLILHYLSRKWGYQHLILVSTLIMLLLVTPAFKGLQHYTSWQILLLIQFILSLIYVGIDGVLIEALGELFPKAYRSLGFGVAWTFSAALVGGTTPLVCTYVIHKTGWLMFPSFYIIIFGLLALPVAMSLKSSKKTVVLH